MPLWISALIAAFKAWLGFRNKEQQDVGATKQQNADLRAGLAAQERINQAEANAPKTDADWHDAASKGEL
jgi:hypothetical protein